MNLTLNVYPCCGAVFGWPHLATCQSRSATLPQWALDASREWGGGTPETPAPEWPGFRTLPPMAMRCEDAKPGMHVMSPVDDFCQLCRVSALKLRAYGAGQCDAKPTARAPGKPAQRVEGIGRALAAVNRPPPLYAPYFWSAKV